LKELSEEDGQKNQNKLCVMLHDDRNSLSACLMMMSTVGDS
jgi:hypothetical protein